MKSYRTLFFDMDGTLLDFDRAEAVGIREVLRRYGLPVTDENAGLYHRVNAKCWQEFEEGILSREQVVVERFHRFFGLKGIQADAAEAETLYRSFLDQSAFLIGGAKELLEELKETGRFQMYVVTNGVAATQRKRIRAAGIWDYFDDVFISEELDSQKPQKLFFDRCLARLGVGADGAEAFLRTALVIGDSLTSDIKGAFNAGIDSCWYNPSSAPNERQIPVTYQIKTLEEIKEILL